MAKVVIQMQGMDALKRAVTEMPKELKRLASHAVRQATWNVADLMRRGVPVRTGTLYGAIEARVPIGTGLTGRVEIGREAWYWRLVEYGSVHNKPAVPFARTAGEVEGLAYEARYAAIGRELERLWVKK